MPYGASAGYPDSLMTGAVKFSHTPAILKIYALAEIAGVTFMTADFDGDPIVFEPWLTLLVDSPREIEFYGAYRCNSIEEADLPGDGQPPNVLLRRSAWRLDEDWPEFNRARDGREYLAGQGRISSTLWFLRLEGHPSLAQLIDDGISNLASNVEITGLSQPSASSDVIEVEVADDRVGFKLCFARFQARCDAIEDWIPAWIAGIEGVNKLSSVKPDGAIRVAYQRSISELLHNLL